MNRKEFLKKTCITGACACGFSAIAMAGNNQLSDTNEEAENKEQLLIQTWIASVLSNMDEKLEDDQIRSILKECSCVHFENLNIDSVLAPYKNNLDGFTKFLEESWDWKVDYNKI